MVPSSNFPGSISIPTKNKSLRELIVEAYWDDISLSDLIPRSEQIQNTILHLHNEARSSVIPPASNMQKMVWISEAAKSAQGVADKCEMASSSPDDRQVDGESCSENIFKSPNAVSWESVIYEWIKHKANFIYGIGATSPEPQLAPMSRGNEPESLFAPYDEGPTCGQCLMDCSVGLCGQHRLTHRGCFHEPHSSNFMLFLVRLLL
ncbi:cysteine-rich venom protein-like [Ctenodactylus gundi]